MPDGSTVHEKLRRTATCLTSPCTGGIEEASSSHQDEAARAKTTRKYPQHFILIHFTTYIHLYHMPHLVKILFPHTFFLVLLLAATM